MRVVLIAGGELPIPPPAYGAAEAIIWYITTYLKKLGHDVLIVNTMNKDEIVSLTNNFNPDVVHLHAEKYCDILPILNCRNVVITGHNVGLQVVTDKTIQDSNYKIIALNDSIRQKYIENNYNPERVFTISNAVDKTLFAYNPVSIEPNKSLYVGQICERKKQYKYQSISSLYFAGFIECGKFKINENYLGYWDKPSIYNCLTYFGNLVLLSDAECHSLAIIEALICGLGVVVSEAASAHLDRSKPWITVIPNDKLDDLQYVETAIINNRNISITCRDEIRKYGLDNFSWDSKILDLVKVYNYGVSSSKKLYCFWTGDNELTPNRKRCLETMKNSGLEVILVTPRNLKDYLIEPLHEGYQYLSLNHKSDYLRCYFMHFYGGGYCDIKEIHDSWVEYYNIVDKDPNVWAIGYSEKPYWYSIDIISKYIKNDNLVNQMKQNCSKLIGNGAFIVRKQTPLTFDWYASLMKLMDSKLEQLRNNPADVTEYVGSTNKNKNYPLDWSEVQAAIFMPLCYKYLDHILNTLPYPKLEDYR